MSTISLSTALGIEQGNHYVLNCSNEHEVVEFTNGANTLGILALHRDAQSAMDADPSGAARYLLDFLTSLIVARTSEDRRRDIEGHLSVLSLQQAMELTTMLMEGKDVTEEKKREIAQALEMEENEIQTGEGTLPYSPNITPSVTQQN